MKDVEKQLIENKIEALSTSKTIHEPIKFRHNECDRIFFKSLENIRKSPTCPCCLAEKSPTFAAALKRIENNRKIVEQKFLAEHRIASGEYTSNDEYISNKIKMSITHNTCGNTFKMSSNDFTRGRSCPYCANKKRVLNTGHREKTLEEVRNEIDKLGEGKYILKSNLYLGNKSKLNILHTECNREYSARFNDFQQGYRCVFCSEEYEDSLGVRKIIEFLEKNNIVYRREAKFKKCRYKALLRFDFQVFSKNNNPEDYFLLEYNGRQHYYVSEKSSWKSSLEDCKIRDKVKLDFTSKYNIPFFIITYLEDPVEKLYEILRLCDMI